MKKTPSIRLKLIKSVMLLIGLIFTVILSIVTYEFFNAFNQNQKLSERIFRNALVTKGKTLTNNNSIAIRGLASDNSYSAIRDLVSATVSGDDEIMYGIYMDANFVPWAHSARNKYIADDKQEPLTDSISKWAYSLKEVSFKTFVYNNQDLIEFAAPIVQSGIFLGTIRYGLSTESMHKSIVATQINVRHARNATIILLLLFAIASLIIGYGIVMRIAKNITKPINALVDSSKKIAEGNYSIAIVKELDDEVGNLAEHFESMRITIKQYTEHLQDLVDEKMQQVNDILNNIDQGLLTFNLDGSVNPEKSAKTGKILHLSNSDTYKLKEVFRLDDEKEREFFAWLSLVKEKYKRFKWERLECIAPVKNLVITSENPDVPSIYVAIEYQRILDKDGNLTKIMILAHDETDKRLKDMQIEQQRVSHEREVKVILAIVNTLPEEMTEFMHAASSGVAMIMEMLQVYLKEFKERTAQGPVDTIFFQKNGDQIHRDIHTLKGNAGGYGFEQLASIMGKAENELGKVYCTEVEMHCEAVELLLGLMAEAETTIQELRKRIQIILGDDESLWVRISRTRIEALQKACRAIATNNNHAAVAAILQECAILTWKPLKTLTRKYEKIMVDAARKLQKNIEFKVTPEGLFLPPQIFSLIDESLVHLVRNAVAHGIELPEVRDASGKGIGIIELLYREENENCIVELRDNGKGIDIPGIVAACLDKKIMRASKLAALSDDEKLQLVFLPGITISKEVTEIYGRGVGLDVVNENMKKVNGKVEIKSIVCEGTSFILTIPKNNFTKCL